MEYQELIAYVERMSAWKDALNQAQERANRERQSINIWYSNAPGAGAMKGDEWLFVRPQNDESPDAGRLIRTVHPEHKGE